MSAMSVALSEVMNGYEIVAMLSPDPTRANVDPVQSYALKDPRVS
jgi:hypothetical protein